MLSHPVAIAFFERHGVDVRYDPSWTYYDAADGVSDGVVDDDPLTVGHSMTLDSDELVATIESDVTVWDVSVAE